MKCISSPDIFTALPSYRQNINSLVSGTTQHGSSQKLFTASRGHTDLDCGNSQISLSPGPVLPWPTRARKCICSSYRM